MTDTINYILWLAFVFISGIGAYHIVSDESRTVKATTFILYLALVIYMQITYIL